VVRVICAGHVNWDVTLRVDRLPDPDGEATITDQFQSGGGSASNVATGLASLDVDVDLLGSVGTDEHGHLVERDLAAVGVDCSHLISVEGSTAVKYLVVAPDGQVMVLGNDGANEAFSADDLPAERLSTAGHLHLTSQDPETAARLAERAGEARTSVSVDPGRRIGDRDYSDVVSRADMVFCNEQEAQTALDRHLGDPDDLDSVVVIKHGAGGAEVLTPAGEYVSHDGYPVEAVDTTGAGDAFAAGFIAVAIDDPDPDYQHALAVANACGALAAQQRGARVTLSWDAIEAFRSGED
jgi:ribokinase